ncbi:KRAB-A domain-containing protein 2-like protein [Plakobranchus ocellatus]|uniref:KRAB-A domain-containing protein 2-like protein n=1 Tax=Plakobranchus ocellatus TaxID=259542 RepID=A0AAV4C7P8_9GAST|nr:KRAB-A domain-containing protein 2-like protein [Plakobranchus ocellatus]
MAELRRASATEKPIPAAYRDSRWQIDVKKMSSCKVYNYILNIIDCYSRFALGVPTKGKTARKTVDASLIFIHLYGSSRILQADNRKEFNNDNLAQVTTDFQVCKINSRTYHLQS